MHFPRRVEVRASKAAQWLNAAIHSIAAFAFLAGGLHWAALLPALGFLWWSWRRTAQAEEAKGVMSLILADDGTLTVESVGGTSQGALCGSSADFAWAVWLHWSGARGRTGALMLLRDNLTAEAWRSLGIWMRHKACRPPREEH